MPWNGSSSFVLSPVITSTNITQISPSGDTTGVTDTGRIQAAVSQLGGGPGAIILAPGQFWWQAGAVIVTSPGVYLYGAGQWATIVNGVGTGTLVRMYSTQQYIPHSHDQAGGSPAWGITFDGNSMGAGSIGVHAGDIYNLTVDAGFRYFGGAGSIGCWLDNNYHWTEQLRGRIWCGNNASNVVFDNSANISGAATGSFDRASLEIYVDQNGLGDGVRFQNGAILIDGRLGIYGNFTGGSSLHYVLNLTGSNAGGFSLIADSTLYIGAELDTLTPTTPATINFNSAGNNTILDCTGILDFGAASQFAGAANPVNSIRFDGPIFGDNFLQSAGPLDGSAFKFSGSGGGGNLANGDTITTRFSELVEVTTSANVTGMILQGFNPDQWRPLELMNNGTGTITFAASGTSHVANGVSAVVQPNSVCRFRWNADLSLWFQVVA